MQGQGFTDSPAAAFTYIRGCVGEEVSEARLRAYLDNAPKAVQYLCENTHLRMHIVPDYADYYQDVPGAMEGGRCLEASPFDGRRLSLSLIHI